MPMLASTTLPARRRSRPHLATAALLVAVAAGATGAIGNAAAQPLTLRPLDAAAARDVAQQAAADRADDSMQAQAAATVERDRAARRAAEAAAAAEAARIAEEERLAAERRAAAEQASRAAVRDPRGAARAMLAEYGWSDGQFSCLDTLWQRESGWKHTADNPTSSAYGIPQALPGSKMASAGADWETNPLTQIRWGLGYIADVYGSPCAALDHSDARNWY